jgi:hypothetical protein
LKSIFEKISGLLHANEGTNKVIDCLPAKNDPSLRLNNLCPYYTMFPLEFPFNRLNKAKSKDWVMDPFCGRGTTNYAARLRGVSSVGVDSNPVAAAIASAKFVNVENNKIETLVKSIVREGKTSGTIPADGFWELCYDTKTLIDICKIRNYLLRRCKSPAEIALNALMLGILHGPQNKGLPTYLSNQMPRTYATKPKPAIKYWIKKKLYPKYVDVVDAVSRRAKFSFSKVPPPTKGCALNYDSRFLSRLGFGRKFQWVITSPPYYKMNTYIQDQWLRNWFLGGPSTVNYDKEHQVSHHGKEKFVNELAMVWKETSKVCLPEAQLIIRFGSLPSEHKNSIQLIKQSLVEADCGWKIITLKNAGHASNGRRQAEQFVKTTEALEEVDLFARLEN